jgi:plastocyanin
LASPFDARARLLALCLVLSTSRAAAAEIAGEVTLSRLSVGSRMAGPQDLVVFLEEALGEVQKGSFRIIQKGKAFSPRLLVVPVGSTVEFPNADHLFHNVFSVAPGNAFDLGSYPLGATRAATFLRPGIVPIYCNIHPQMITYVLVVNNPFHVRPSAAGRFRLEGVPAGSHHVVVWSPHTAPFRAEVHVAEGSPVTLRLAVHEWRSTERHLNKEGKAYVAY